MCIGVDELVDVLLFILYNCDKVFWYFWIYLGNCYIVLYILGNNCFNNIWVGGGVVFV